MFFVKKNTCHINKNKDKCGNNFVGKNKKNFVGFYNFANILLRIGKMQNSI